MPDTQTRQRISTMEIEINKIEAEVKETDDSLTELEKSLIALRTKQEFIDKALEHVVSDTAKKGENIATLVKQTEEIKQWQANVSKILSWIGVTFSGSFLGLIARAIYNYVSELLADGHSTN